MRRRSVTGPLLLLIVGALFLWNNLHPETPVFELIARYWPFLLIGWGVLRLVEALAGEGRGLCLHRRRSSAGGADLHCRIRLWEARRHGIHFRAAA